MPLNLMKHTIYVIFAIFAALLFGATSSQAQWTADTKLSVTDTNAMLSENADICLAASGDSVHVVWWDTKKDSSAIYYRHSYDGGITWSAPMRITPFTKSVDFPSIAISGSVVHVAWRDNSDSGSYYIHSTDGGNTWGSSISLGTYYFWPSIAASGSNAYMTFNSSITGNSEVYFRRSTDNGTTWNPTFQISNAPNRSEDQSISASGSYIDMVWNDNRTGIMQAWYRRSSDNGVTWGPETQLSNALKFSYFPMVNASGKYVDVVRGDRDSTNLFHIKYMQSSDSGTTWSPEIELSNNSTGSAYPVIKRDGLNVHVVWWDFNSDLFYRNSTDGGVTWSSIQSLVSYSNKPSKPFIEISGPVLHVIWIDAREGHSEVYYKRNPTGNPIAKSSGKFSAPATVDFGDVKVGGVKDTTITLQNTGASTLNILGYSLVNPDSGFMIIDTSVHQIAAQGSTTIRLRFNAIKAQSYSGTITVTTDESGNGTHQIQLTGLGVNSNIMFGESQVDFGNVDTGSTVQKTFTLKSVGTLSATIDSLEIKGSSEFAITPTQLPLTIKPGGIDSITISFSPHQLGPAQADVLLKISNASWALGAHLTGNGIPKKDTTLSSVQIKNALLSLLEVTPNPALKNAVLKLATTRNLENVNITFYNSAGQLLSSQHIGSLGEGMQNISLVLPQISGIAFLRILSGGELIGTAEIAIVR
jgi:hypothetical protein